jgi:two-component system phosphate regulon response regulator OmpR
MLRSEQAQATVLVVDDDTTVRQVLEELLRSAGFTVATADTGARLPDLVRQQQPHVVLLDQLMQPVSGLEALQALRASGQDVPVIMLTALGGDDLVQTALETGADDYVTKPFSNAVLVAHIRAALRRQRWQAREREASRPRSFGVASCLPNPRG